MGEQVKRPYREGEGVKPKSPKPTPGIMQTKKFEDGTTTYRISCSCDSPDCDLNVWIEGSDLDFDAEYAVKIYAKARTPIWKEGYSRFKTAMKLLFTGETEYETETLMTAEQALVFADTLKTMVTKTEKQRQADKKAKAKKPPEPPAPPPPRVIKEGVKILSSKENESYQKGSKNG